MSKQINYLISFVFVLGVTLTSASNAADLNLVGWWKMDNDGTGVITDYSGNNRDGTIHGDPQFVSGIDGDALEFDGDGDFVVIDGFKGIFGDGTNTPPFSIAVWIRKEGPVGGDAEVLGWGSSGTGNRLDFRFNGGNNRLRIESGGGNIQGDVALTTGEWTHVVVTLDENATYVSDEAVNFYFDGVLVNRPNSDTSPIHPTEGADVVMGQRYNQAGDRWFVGALDDVRIYDKVLVPAEVRDIIEFGYLASAHSPSPAEGSVYIDTWATLRWAAGGTSVSHNLYFGTSLEDVSAGAESTFVGSLTVDNQTVGFAGFPAPEGLASGTTYYWRVDEVNDAHPDSPWEGEVWSFWLPSITGFDPVPQDGEAFEDPDIDLSWSPGMNATLHGVYFGTDAAEIESAAGAPPHLGTTFDPGTLDADTTYYWRVDTFNGSEWIKGPLWSFSTGPEAPPVADPNLVVWYKFNEGAGTNAFDWSGHGNHGKIFGNPQWVAGYDDGAMEFGGSPDYVSIDGYKGILRIADDNQHAFTCAAWIKTTSNGVIMNWGHTSGRERVEFRVDGGRLRVEHGDGNIRGDTNVNDDEWHHVAAVVPEGAAMKDVVFYLDGEVDNYRTIDNPDNLFNITANHDLKLARRYDTDDRWYTGLIDDARLYDVALTQEGIKLAMRSDPKLAWDPIPADGSTVNIDVARPFSWLPGDFAAQHDVYIGTDVNSVADANMSDTLGIYCGRQGTTSYSPPAVEYDETYYWRIDEVEADDTKVHKGRVWNFTVANFIVLDDFEDYNDYPPDEIFSTWIDGWDVPTNGSLAGYADPPFAETTIVNGGRQSMPLYYDNNFKYSEATMTLSSQRDWTRQGVKSLSLWFRGHPVSVGRFKEEPSGTYTLAVRSVGNITGTSDEFHFAWKTLSGPGSIIAKVEWVRDADDNAQAGVMIRDTLEANSAHASVLLETNDIAADWDLRFRRRATTDGDSTTTTVDGIMAPQWLKIERDMIGNVTGAYSADGVTWTDLGGELITMSTPIYIGLVVASENINVTCEAQFSNVQITGMTGPQWTNQDIGIVSNSPERMYIALANAGGTPAVVYYEDPDDPDAIPTQIGAWTQWDIALEEFARQGVNLANVNTISIGFGDKNNPGPGSSGTMYFDDIRLYRPRCVLSLLKPEADFNNDCVVDYLDLEIMVAGWLISDAVVATVAPDPNGLVVHYKFDGNADDSSGNNYHGIEKDGPTYVDGKFGQAIHFDGFDDYVAITDVNYTGTGYPEVTVCAWVRTTDGAGNIASFDRNEYYRLQTGGEAGGPGLVGWHVWTSDGQIDTQDAPNWPANTGRVDDGQWHHVAGVFDNGTLTIYIDGGPREPYFGGATFGTDNAYARYGIVGAGCEASYPPPSGRANNFSYLEGDLDELYIYDRALSQAEIAYLADETSEDGELYILVASVTNIYDEEAPLSRSVNFKDFALLADSWLDEQLWPQP